MKRSLRECIPERYYCVMSADYFSLWTSATLLVTLTSSAVTQQINLQYTVISTLKLVLAEQWQLT